ncbi:MAG: cytochrome c oxidase subunit I [Gemmatimonadales bacterium]
MMATAEAGVHGVPGSEAKATGTYSGGIWSWITTVDHKRIGILYFVSALAFFLIGGIEAMFIRLQLATPENTLLSPQAYNQLFTMHGVTMLLFAIMPMSAAFFNFIVPLQIGARDVAFPRLNAFSYWLFLFGALFLNSSFFLGGAPDVGWFAYANLTSSQFSPGHGVDFYILGLALAGAGSIVAALNFIVTIINLRAPGMTFMRLPLFTWMTFVVSFLIILAFPPFTISTVFLLFDRMFGTLFFEPAGGGDPRLWQHLFWIFGHPEVYILILPAFGIVSDVIPTFARKPLFGYPVVVYSGVLIAFLGFGVWAHHMFSVGLGPVANSAFSGLTMLIAIPTGVKIFNWIATMWGGALRFRTAMLFSVGLVGMFVIGGLSGVMHSAAPADLQQTDTYFVVAHFHYVLFGGSVLGLFAGVYYWFPKVTGRFLNERLGAVHFWLMFLGLNLTFFPMHFAGLLGQPRRTFTYPAGLGFEGFNLVSTIGAAVTFLAVLVFLVNLVRSLRAAPTAEANPWEASTIEWSISSPPPPHNFDRTPEITSRDPLWHDGIAPSAPGEEEFHMPNPSFWPLVVAGGLLLVMAGVLVGLPLVLFGVAVTLVGIYGWSFEPIH